jgi:succinate dehydrogenase / fumarate reductase, cytochrome b subunit
MTNAPAPTNFWRWFDPRNRSISTWAFILNRITGLGLTLYLFIHLIALSQLAIGQEAYYSFISLVHSPLFKMAEMLVIAGGLIHGLNGIRVGMTSLGIASNQQKAIFVGMMVLALVGILFFGIKMFSV